MAQSCEENSMQFDVLIIGAGPAGLASAYRLASLAEQSGQELSIAVLEKASSIGGHIISGCVFESDVLSELLPDWQEDEDCPVRLKVAREKLLFLTKKRSKGMMILPQMKNEGNYIISLGELCKWIAEKCEKLGVQIFAGFAATEILYSKDGAVAGVKTGEFGRDKHGNKTDNYQEPLPIYAKHTIFAEGARGSLTKELEENFNLRANKAPQTYALGIKEIWQIDPAKYKNESKYNEGNITHTIGFPLDRKTYGGGFIYHMQGARLAVGLVVGLDYENPSLSPFKEMQKFKTHPCIRPLLEDAERISYGARVLNEGGFASVPDVSFAGGSLVGCAAGFVNIAKIKGVHNAIKSGILCAESLFEIFASSKKLQEAQAEAQSEKLDKPDKPDIITITDYQQKLHASSIMKELKQVRNIRQAFAKWGLYGGIFYSGLEQIVFRSKLPWNLKHKTWDHQRLKKISGVKQKKYNKPDGKLTFDVLSSVYLSNSNHEENQPKHLLLKDAKIWQVENSQYGNPEIHYCPAGVYELTEEQGKNYLQINATNCLHCKTCDVKDPKQNIIWKPPEGGGGPNYTNM